jgi:hypothetical protein
VISILNGMAGGDAAIISNNNMAASILFYSLFVIIIMLGLWVLKSSIKREPDYGGAYA